MAHALTLPLVLAGLVALAVPVRADDLWEDSDDTSGTTNLLRHGVVQSGHDLEGAPPATDVDWLRVVTKTRHSYEARVSGSRWQDGCTGSSCGGSFQRVDATGAVLSSSFAAADDPAGVDGSYGRTLRWTTSNSSAQYLRVSGAAASTVGDRPYDVVFYDTTLFVPRWNNTSTQVTVIVLQNTTAASVGGLVHFYSDAGSLLATTVVNVPPNGVEVLPVASIAGLAGQSGSAAVAHLGGYAALVGKAVALEPATGFTFDTAIAPLAR